MTAQEIAERRAMDDAEIEAIWAPIIAARERPALAAAGVMAGYMSTILTRCAFWALRHAARARQRELSESEQAFEATARIFWLLEDAVVCRGIGPSTLWAAERAFDAALWMTHLEPSGGDEANLSEHIEEMSGSPIRRLLWTIAGIADRHWQMCEGLMTPAEAGWAACEDLLGAVPPPPEEEESASC